MTELTNDFPMEIQKGQGVENRKINTKNARKNPARKRNAHSPDSHAARGGGYVPLHALLS